MINNEELCLGVKTNLHSGKCSNLADILCKCIITLIKVMLII
jgi:hypothetical protein